MVTKRMDVLEHVYVSYTWKVHLIFLKKLYKDFLNEDKVERNNNPNDCEWATTEYSWGHI